MTTPTPVEQPLEAISFFCGRLYYNYVGLLTRLLKDAGLDRYITPGMGHILFTLFSEDDLIIGELAKRTRLSGSTLTGMLQRMERTGLIRRRKNSRDNREVRVRLSALGRSLQPQCEQVLARIEAIMQQDMTTAEAAEFRRLAKTIIASMAAHA